MHVGLALGYLAALLGVVAVVPQIVRTLRFPHVGGVSSLAWSLTALAGTAWLTYGLRTTTWPQVPGNVLLITGALVIVLLVPSATSVRRRALLIGTAALSVVSFAFLLPPHLVGYLAFSIGLFSSWPQLYDSFATWRAGHASAVSLPTWSLRMSSQACWLAYAVTDLEVPVLISAAVKLSSALTLVVLEASTRWARRAALEPA